MLGVLTALALAAPASEPVVEVVRGGRTTRQTREVMQTRVTIAIADPPRDALANHQLDFHEAFAIFTRVDRATNEKNEASALSVINAAAGPGPVPAPAELCKMIGLSLDAAKKSKGLFDPTSAVLRELWKFPADGTATVPDADALKALCKRVSWKNVEVKALKKPTSEAACTVRFKKPGMQLGLEGIAKGWAIDQAVKLLRGLGYQNFFVQAGDNQFLSGKVGDRAWKVSIRDPRGTEGKPFLRTEVSNSTFTTSSDDEHFFVKDGVRYHPLIDPRSCQPARKSVVTTVLAKTAVEAEYLSKVAFILGWPEGERLTAAAHAQLVLVDAHGGVHFSPALKPTLEWSNPSGFATPEAVHQ